MRYPEVSIIIASYNSQKTIKRNLDSLIELKYPKNRLEIIYIDDGSIDNSVKIISEYCKKYNFIKLIRQNHKGIGAARNLGIKNAKYNIIAFIDSDCFADNNWLKQINRNFNKKVGAVAGSIIPDNPQNRLEKYLASLYHSYRQDYSVMANFAFRKDLLEVIGYFDENLISGEDVDFSWRLAKSNIRVKYVKEAVVTHKMRSNMTSLIKWAYRDGKGWAQLEKKYKIKPKKYESLIQDNLIKLFNNSETANNFKGEGSNQKVGLFWRILYYFLYISGYFIGLVQ